MCRWVSVRGSNDVLRTGVINPGKCWRLDCNPGRFFNLLHLVVRHV